LAYFIGRTAATLLGGNSGRIDRLEKQNAEILAHLHGQQSAELYGLEAK
jgi:hypothetical protein